MKESESLIQEQRKTGFAVLCVMMDWNNYRVLKAFPALLYW